MNYSRLEWLLIALSFALSVAANLPAGLSESIALSPMIVQIALLVSLVLMVIRHIPFPLVIVLGMLFAGSGAPRLLGGHFQLGHWLFLALAGLALALSLARHLFNALDQEGSSPAGASQSLKTLFRVVEQGNLAWTYRLLAMGADINVRNEAGKTPLMCAAEKGYADMVQVLLQHGANPRLENNQGQSAMTIALMKGYTRIAEALNIADAAQGHERVGNGQRD
jgi:hypothetical protein